MTWNVRIYDLASRHVFAADCPPGQCGDLVLGQVDDGRLILGMEEFVTHPAQGAVVKSRILVLSSRGKPEAEATFVHAYRDASIGVADTGTCGMRALVADPSPFALQNLKAVTPSDGGAVTVRFAQSAWQVSGTSQAAPTVSFLPVLGMKP